MIFFFLFFKFEYHLHNSSFSTTKTNSWCSWFSRLYFVTFIEILNRIFEEDAVMCQCACAGTQGPGWGFIFKMKDHFLQSLYLLFWNPLYVFYLGWGKITFVLLWLQFEFHYLYNQQWRHLFLEMWNHLKEDSWNSNHKWWSSANGLNLVTLCVWWWFPSSSRCWLGRTDIWSLHVALPQLWWPRK